MMHLKDNEHVEQLMKKRPAGKPPCRICDNELGYRSVKCHDKCPYYIEYKEELDGIRKVKDEEGQMKGYFIEASKRMHGKGTRTNEQGRVVKWKW